MQQERTNDDILVTLSFSSYSTNGLAAIAVKVRNELNEEAVDVESALDTLDDSDFEFSVVLDDEGVQADDEAIYDAQIPPIFPNSNRNFGGQDDLSIRIPLSKLFNNGSSSSSSEGDELETIPARAFCFWRPKLIHPSPNRSRKKRNSTGSRSKPWKLCHLLRRSNSDGKGPFLFLTPNHRAEKADNKSKKLWMMGGNPVMVLEKGRLQAENRPCGCWLRLSRCFMYGIEQKRKEERENRIFLTGNLLVDSSLVSAGRESTLRCKQAPAIFHHSYALVALSRGNAEHRPAKISRLDVQWRSI